MNQMEKDFGLTEMHKAFNKNSSDKLKLECLSNYGIYIKKDYLNEVTNILFDMVNKSFIKEIKKFSIEDMFNVNSSIVFRTYLEHYSLDSTTFSETHFIVDYFEGFCLNIEKKIEISKIFFIKNKEKILKLLKPFLEEKEVLIIKKEALLINLLQFIFVTQINSGHICKDKKTYLKFSELNYSDYLFNNALQNGTLLEKDFSKISIPYILPNLIENIDCNWNTLVSFMRKSNGFLDYITCYGSVRNDLKTRELKMLVAEIGFQNLSFDLRLKSYKALLKKAFNTKGVTYLEINRNKFKDTIINSILYYEQALYNLNEKELENLKTRLEV